MMTQDSQSLPYDHPRRVAARAKIERARELRAQGWTWAAVAVEAGYTSASAASSACYRASVARRPAKEDARRPSDERRELAKTLRASGWTYREIAAHLGYATPQAVYRLLHREELREARRRNKRERDAHSNTAA